MKALKIDVCGTMELAEITGETIEQQNGSIYSLIGCDCDCFATVRLGEDAVMLVDDEGLLKGLPVNAMAIMISDYPMLVGTALIVGIDVTADGEQAFGSCPARFLRFADQIGKLRGSSS
jgi:hypothetical protein